MIVRNWTFSIAAIVVLALGIGANTAVFSVINAVLLRPVPYARSERMVVIWGNYLKLQIEQLRAKAADYVDYRDQTTTFESVAAFASTDLNLSGGPQPERIAAASITPNLFPTLSATAAQGRLFSSDETLSGQNHVVIISDRFWKRRLGAAGDVIGKSVRLNDENFTVIGVMPSGFQFPHPSFNFAEPAEVWIPLTILTEQVTERRRPHYLNVIGLLKPDAGLDKARAELTAIDARTHQEEGGWRTTIVPLREQIVAKSRRSLLVLLAAVTLVLLISCANAANLLLMRATTRGRELAIRASIGASRMRLMRQLLTESMVISALACVAGITIAWWSLKFLVVLDRANLPRIHEITLDWRVLSFASGLAVLTGLMFGLVPALRASRTELHQNLKESGTATTSGRHWLRSLLVVAEMALATLLLIGAGLMINSLFRLQHVDPVVRADRLLSVEINLAANRYSAGSRMSSFYADLIQRVEALPGVESASLSTTQALNGVATNDPFVIEGRPLDMKNAPVASWQLVAPDYFQTMGIPLVAGREFTAHDDELSGNAAIVSQALVDRYFPNGNALGKRMTLGLPRPDNPWLSVVGIVKDVPQRGLGSKSEPGWYMPLLRKPRRDFYLMVRSKGDPLQIERGVREQVVAIDKDQPVTEIRTLTDVIASTTAPRRFNARLLSIFATIAIALSAIGTYSVIAYSVTQRTREIGIRMALGARNEEILKSILKSGMTLALLGAAIGVGLAATTSRFLAGLLFNVKPTDPVTFGVVSCFLIVVALFACYLPALRATRIDPLIALRSE